MLQLCDQKVLSQDSYMTTYNPIYLGLKRRSKDSPSEMRNEPDFAVKIVGSKGN